MCVSVCECELTRLSQLPTLLRASDEAVGDSREIINFVVSE